MPPIIVTSDQDHPTITDTDHPIDQSDCVFPRCEYWYDGAFLAHVPHRAGEIESLPDGGFHQNSFCHRYRAPGEEFAEGPIDG